MNVPNVRIESGLELRVRLKDNGVSLDWSSLQGVKALLYSVEQKAVAGAAEVAIDKEDSKILIVKYPGSSPQYTGLAKLIVRCEYNGKQKTYDTAVANFVETTDEATGVLVLDDPTVSVTLSVEEVSTSLLDEAINAAFAAAELARTEAANASDIGEALSAELDAAKATNAEVNANEQVRETAEAKRESNEAARIASDNARMSAEESRQAAEIARESAESRRGQAENERQSNEEQRISTFDTFKTTIDSKQDAIADLAEIRSGASKGATALQSYTETDPVYMADKPSLATKKELATKQDTLIPGNGISIEGNVISATVGGGEDSPIDLSDYAKKADVNIALEQKVDKVTGKGLSSNDYTDADKLKLAGLENYDDAQIRELIAGKANLQHRHTVADITDFPELYYDATAFFTSGAYPSDKYKELLEAVKAKKTIYATIDEEGYISYVFFMSTANSDGSSSRVLLTTIFVDGGNLYINTFVLQQSGKTALQESITSKADKATTLAGYGISDAYTKSEVDAAIEGKQDKITIFTETEGLSSYSINPNMLTKLGTLASNVTLSLNTASEESVVTNVYDIIFVTPADAPSITWPEGISWIGGSAPAIAGGKTYEVSIMDNLATYGEF